MASYKQAKQDQENNSNKYIYPSFNTNIIWTIGAKKVNTFFEPNKAKLLLVKSVVMLLLLDSLTYSSKILQERCGRHGDSNEVELVIIAIVVFE